MILTYLVPAGQYERVMDPQTGQELVIADSFTYLDSTPVNPLKMFELIGEGFVQQGQLIFLIMFAYAFMDALVKCGVFDSLFGLIFKHGLHKRKIILPLIMCFFGLLGSVAGMAEEIFGQTQHHPYTTGLFGSIPDMNKPTDRLSPIDGLMPDPLNLPEGCVFNPRCPHCMDICRTEAPKNKTLDGSHMICCHLFDDRNPNKEEAENE